MNIFEKIDAVRIALLEAEMKKKKSAYSYKYIDLPQIEPNILEECHKVKMLTMVDFPQGFAVMKVYDLEADSMNPALQISVPCEASLVDIKGSQPIQKVGGMMTYMRRYLYMQLFAISEHDSVEGIGSAEREIAMENAEDDKKEVDPKVKEIADKLTNDFPDYAISLLAFAKKKHPQATSLYDLEASYIQEAYDKQVTKRTAQEANNEN